MDLLIKLNPFCEWAAFQAMLLLSYSFIHFFWLFGNLSGHPQNAALFTEISVTLFFWRSTSYGNHLANWHCSDPLVPGLG